MYLTQSHPKCRFGAGRAALPTRPFGVLPHGHDAERSPFLRPRNMRARNREPFGMGKRLPSNFRKTDLARAVEGARTSGITPTMVEITGKDGVTATGRHKPTPPQHVDRAYQQSRRSYPSA